MDCNGTGYFDSSEVLNSCGEILKNLQTREKALKSILENLDLNLSDFGVSVQRKIEAAAETLLNQRITEVNKENIISSHLKKTLEKDEQFSVYARLARQKAEIDHEHNVSRELNTMYNNAIKTYNQGIKKVTAELSQNVGPTTVVSPETKAASSSNAKLRDLQRRVSVLCEKLIEKKKIAKELDERLSAFHGLPTDVESANHEVFLKKRELEEIRELMQDFNVSQ